MNNKGRLILRYSLSIMGTIMIMFLLFMSGNPVCSETVATSGDTINLTGYTNYEYIFKWQTGCQISAGATRTNFAYLYITNTSGTSISTAMTNDTILTAETSNWSKTDNVGDLSGGSSFLWNCTSILVNFTCGTGDGSVGTVQWSNLTFLPCVESDSGNDISAWKVSRPAANQFRVNMTSVPSSQVNFTVWMPVQGYNQTHTYCPYKVSNTDYYNVYTVPTLNSTTMKCEVNFTKDAEDELHTLIELDYGIGVKPPRTVLPSGTAVVGALIVFGLGAGTYKFYKGKYGRRD